METGAQVGITSQASPSSEHRALFSPPRKPFPELQVYGRYKPLFCV